jgi:murein L,D-transpeptidase YcbB/YkuD
MTPRRHYHGAPRGAAFFALALALSACGRNSPAPDPVVEARRAIARVFETSVPYSSQTVAQSDVDAFLAKFPEYAADSSAIADFYSERSMQHAWVLDGRISASAESFITLAGVAERRGKDAPQGARRLRALYDAATSRAERVPLCDSCGTELELLLTAEFYRFAGSHYGGYLNTDVRDLNWFIPRAKKDFAKLLDSLARGKMDMSGYQPGHQQYKLLQPQLREYSKLVSEPWPELSFPPRRTKLKIGDSASVIGGIRRRLQLLGDFSGDTAAIRYDSSLAEGVRHFQARHGMNTDGLVDAALLKALNVPPATRMRTMLINMERLRWVSEEQPANLLLVNIPEFRLHVFEENNEVMTMNVVVGASATRTVTFTDTLTQVVFSPSWSIPRNIVQNEILPAIEEDPDYLTKHDMEVVGGTDADPEIRQRPGASNALGRVKFLFPNSYSIYMHDTPSRGLFGGEKRAASHGCIRLSRAADLAEYLLRNDPEWTADRIHEAMMSGKEKVVKLSEPRPVAIVYFTAWVDRDGALNFRDDVYGHDRDLAAELFADQGAPASAPGSAGG